MIASSFDCGLQRKVDASAQPIRDYKGQSRQMITMAFLEEGGYFDVPIQVCTGIVSVVAQLSAAVCGD